jgi:hypothetical protein
VTSRDFFLHLSLPTFRASFSGETNLKNNSFINNSQTTQKDQ